MANKIQLKRSSVAGRVPATTDLDLGELALNTRDGKLYTKTSDGSTEAVVQLSVDATVVKTTDSGTVTSAMLADGTIVNADINASAAIAGTKISPDFGSQTVQTTGVVSHALGTAGAPTVTFTGDTNTGIYSPGADQVAISTGGTGRLFVDANGKVLVGTNTSRSIGGAERLVQIEGTSASSTNLSITRNSNDSNQPSINFAKTRGTSNGSLNAVLANDNLGGIIFTGADGSSILNGAYIESRAESNASAGFLPCFISVGTGGSERLRVTSDGKLGLGTSSPSAILHATSADDAKTAVLAGATNRIRAYGHLASFGGSVVEATNNAESAYAPLLLNGSSLTLGNNGTAIATVTSVGVGIGTTTPANRLHLQTSTGGCAVRVQSGSTYSGTVLSQNAADAYISNESGATGTIQFWQNGSERARIDSSGRLLVGYSSARANFFNSTITAGIQLEGAGIVPGNRFLAQVNNYETNGDGGPVQILARAKGSSLGSTTAVISGDHLGQVSFQGSDGTQFVEAAKIEAYADGTVGADDMPGRLVFSTTADGASSPTERVRITSGGYFKASNDGTYQGATDTTHELRQTSTSRCVIVGATNASYAEGALTVNVTRAANAAYSFFHGLSGNFGDLEFSLYGDGNGKCDGSWTGGGADYAEYFEWSDSNPGAEDRRGISVVLDGDKIRPALTGEDPIGVISGNPSVVGDAAWNKWSGKYLRDEFGTYILEDYEVTDDDGNTVTQQRRKLNPAYDPDVEYTSREERPEWDCVGLMGKLRIRKGQPTGSRWIKMRDISDSVEEWLVR